MILLEGIDVTSTYITVQILYYVFAVALYFLMSYGFYRMAMRRNIDKAFLAFIPFARYVIAGKVIGQAIVFGKKTDKIGLIVAIVSAIYFATSLFTFIYNNYLFFCALDAKLPIELAIDGQTLIDGKAIELLMEIHYKSKALNIIANIIHVISMIASLAWLVFMFIFWNNLFVKFKPTMVFMYTFIAVIIAALTYEGFIIPLEVGGLFVFIFRNRDEIKITNFYNPYGNPNGYNGYDPYGRGNQNAYDPYGRSNQNNNYGGQGNGSQSDPFEEFGDNKKDDTNNPFGM